MPSGVKPSALFCDLKLIGALIAAAMLIAAACAVLFLMYCLFVSAAVLPVLFLIKWIGL